MNLFALLFALIIFAGLFFVLVYLPYKTTQDEMNKEPSSAPPEGFRNYATYKYKTFSRKY